MAGKAKQLTARGLATLRPGEWASDTLPHGAGQLQARGLASGGAAFYYRYTAPGRRQVRVPMGSGLTLAEARAKAGELSRRYQEGDRNLRETLRPVAAPLPPPADTSLGALLTAYVDALRAAGRVSARRVEACIHNHVRDTWPTLWAAPARDLDIDALLPVVSRLVRAGTLREAAKVRAYLRAAYAAAIRARQDPAAPDSLRALGITSNPVRDLVTIEGANRARSRDLQTGELRLYWRHISALPAPHGPLLRFHLLTGGQRINQLARLEAPDLDLEALTVTLLDPKGRRRQPREHVVPLIPPAVDALQAMRGRGLGPYLFTATEGAAAASYDLVHDAIKRVARAMDAAGELEAGLFTPGDLRRTVESRLAALGLSDETRAHLQSHGLGGVQNRHYNRHRYDAEKRAALEALHTLVAGRARARR